MNKWFPMNSSSCRLRCGGVHRQASQKGPDDPLQVDRLGRHGGDGDQQEHEGELSLLGRLIGEQLLRHPTQPEKHGWDVNAELDNLDDERIGGEPRHVDRNADREHQQGGHVGEHRCADGHGDRLVPQLAELLHDRVRDQGVGGEQRADEQGPDPGVSGPQPNEKSRRERKREREQAEGDGPVTGAVELHQVDFHPGEEHQ